MNLGNNMLTDFIEGILDIATRTITDPLDELIETGDLLFGDPETDGKKKGYERATQEYKIIVSSL